MGVNILARGRNRRTSADPEATMKERFAAYYPRLFAYLHACLGNDEAVAKELVVEAFAQAFQRSPNSSEEAFRSTLLAAARRLLRRRRGPSPPNDPLTPREREVLSLAFDFQLPRREIARLLHLREDTVTATLLQGLRKLRDQTSPSVLAAYLRLT